MIDKRAVLQGDVTVELLAPQQRVKTAGARPAVQAFLDSLKPDPTYTYALVNAMGFSEYFGPNSNADWYGFNPHLGFNGLLHAWPDIGQDIVADRMKGKDWPYGYPCFYNAAVYAHHKNTCPVKLGFGDVIFAFANLEMKRIELLMRVHNEEAKKKGHMTILERVAGGSRSDVSMGARVPFDLCVAPGTLLRTPEGHRKIEELEVGDKVLTHKGRYRAVTRTFAREHRGTSYEIQAYGMPGIQATEGHPFLVVRREALRACKTAKSGGQHRRHSLDATGHCRYCKKHVRLDPVWVTAEDLRVGDYLLNPRQLDSVGTGPGSARAKLLGYYLGDGFPIRIRRNRNRDGEYYSCGVGISCSVLEEEHIEQVIRTFREAGARNEVTIQNEGDAYAVSLRVSDVALAAWLESRAGRGSRGKYLHEEIFGWSLEERLAVVGGYLDTDGSVSREGAEISSVNKGLMLDLVQLLSSVGIPSAMNGKPQRATTFSVDGSTIYSVRVGLHHLGALAAHSLKAAKARPSDTRAHSSSRAVTSSLGLLLPIRGIRECALPYVHNIRVAEDESYVANGVATHNCSICTDWPAVKKAMATFDPVRHRHEGIAVLEYHRKIKAIRGLAVTRDEYCTCVRTMKNKILPSGEKVFLWNDWPRFFDISFVYIGADRTARVMWHLSQSAGRPVTADPMLGALEHFLELGKVSALEKEIPGTVEQVLHDADTSPEFDLGTLFPKAQPAQLLSSAASLGIVATPGEFQALVAPGLTGLFDDRTSVVDPSLSVDPGKVLSGLLPALHHLCAERSSFAPYLESRLPELPIPKVAQQDRQVCRTEAHTKIAALYNGYRLSVLEKSAGLTQRAEGLFIDPLAKVAGAEALAGLLLGAAPVLHLVASHLRRQNDEGKQLGTMAQIVADNPTFLSLATLGAGIRMAMIAEKGGILAALARLLQAAPKI